MCFAARFGHFYLFFCRLGQVNLNLDCLVDILDNDSAGCHAVRNILRRNQYIQSIQIAIKIGTCNYLSRWNNEILGGAYR